MTNTTKTETKVEANVYLPELLLWFHKFLREAQNLSAVLDIAPGELDALAEVNVRFLNAAFQNGHACRVNCIAGSPNNPEDLRRDFFQAVRFLIARLKTHPAMTAERYCALGLKRPECRYICKENEGEHVL
jgi:hypothetical protein